MGAEGVIALVLMTNSYIQQVIFQHDRGQPVRLVFGLVLDTGWLIQGTSFAM
jgi:hypothetical protein